MYELKISDERNLQQMEDFFRSIIEQDNCNVVICNLEHKIIYMNKAAIKSYEKRGGEKLIGASLLACHNEQSGILIKKVVDWFYKSPDNNKIHTFFNERQNKDVYMIALRNDKGDLIGYYEKHEFRNKDTTLFYEGI